jgi:DNA-binding response OmpR family regulator/DNA-binding CsgD family transcriptional regulator
MASHEPRDIVLVVDDSPNTLRMLTDAIEGAGMTVLVALDGEQALSLIERITPDVILMDAVMPGLDGFEICRRLKRNPALSHVPIIFMTGLSETGDIIKGLDAGGVDYVTKPIAPDELLARIRVHLSNARISQSARAALDASGRFLLAASRAGRILWSTPQAAKLLSTILPDFNDTYVLPPHIREWLHQSADRKPPSSEGIGLNDPNSSIKLELSVISQIGSDEILLRLIEGDPNNDQLMLRNKLRLTQREAEVLLWIARGKSNRDVAEILTLSPRTVNKHLEQIFNKLGVENRTSAAALATRTLGTR